ncbi:helix-hairpin-helix domain-containing protein [Eggerthella sp. YY7918]|uniref:helix-hairpin-helix domain-containing protein n=1 Tax=Eggerthella sp. (strain YY7918) TaxID=502558 RepID=UPI00021718B5|nr:helix-hairpin-helix domain-containing protein [Eggerthella sp. YY7918]BAK44599.1 DNA uptake protein [Eggerthella sp. YY7918]
MAFQDQASTLRAKAHLSGARWPVLVGVTALALLVLVFAGKLVLDAISSESFAIERTDEAVQASSQEEASAAEAPREPARIFVHVGGAVANPGVQELEEGSRVQNAVEAAGGFSEEAAPDALNLARVLTDGEQVVVPTREEAAAPVASDISATGGTSRVNINTASTEELDTLPGIGPSTAEKIVADREANGPFATIEDLKRVSGIGDKKYANLSERICVG